MNMKTRGVIIANSAVVVGIGGVRELGSDAEVQEVSVFLGGNLRRKGQKVKDRKVL